MAITLSRGHRSPEAATGKPVRGVVEAPDPTPSPVENRLADLGESVVRRCSRLLAAHEADLDERLALGGELHEAWKLLGESKNAFGRWLTRSGWEHSQPTAWYHRMLAEHEDVVRRVFKTQGMDAPVNYKAVVDLIRQAPEYVEAVCAGELGIKEALHLHRRTRKDERYGRIRTEADDLALFGTYAVILADPAWDWANSLGPNRSVKPLYPTMDLEEIKGLKVPAADDAVLFLWVPNALLPDGLVVMDAWGFEYKSNFAWVKGCPGMGSWVRSQHELLLIGRRGNFPPPDAEARHPSVIEAPRCEHSAKPDVVYEIIEHMYPGLPKLELFARSEREGWTAWGDQVPT
jgi:N6-adenosine-specific RNA methylase IME4